MVRILDRSARHCLETIRHVSRPFKSVDVAQFVLGKKKNYVTAGVLGADKVCVVSMRKEEPRKRWNGSSSSSLDSAAALLHVHDPCELKKTAL